ncbi:urease accessory protein UreE [Cyanobium sp. Alchichica 3B3-8F6]|uniref:urease accessory protein UreE n=1 Tax=Cyanobium sp. Alchichica 3B3-8F6 TaxID=2823696 RepID=UPI0020CD8E07|nr:urease accessory protein UreE [Cyanobium sp. Alchichica 3B3-8F6]MCP9881659.1 urease accessory protein UreE [Cyanobium sp. Alchichica 3B3-8F6]
MADQLPGPLQLIAREASRPGQLAQHWRLPLRAHERSQLRGWRVCQEGQEVLLQLPRQEPLRPGEWLLPAQASDASLGVSSPGVAVEVVAAEEDVLEIGSHDSLALLQAAYHLGNRHVAMEIHADRLLLLHDSVLADLLEHRGLELRRLRAPFCPEAGAYAGHAHSHASDHDH